MNLPRTLFAGAALVAAGLGVSARAQTVGATTLRASPFTGLTVFGDSLSDDGNIALATGLPNLTGTSTPQKFTTNPGNVTIENVAAAYGLALAPSLAGGSDLAFGGAGVQTNAPGTPAGVPTVSAQITGYLAADPKLDPNRLYSVFGGANDIFYHAAAAAAGAQASAIAGQLTVGLPAAQAAAVTAAVNAQAAATAGVAAVETSAQASQAVLTAAQQEVTLLGALHAAGAQRILVFNLPDIGATPEGRAAGAAGSAALTGLSTAYNTLLNSGLQVLRTGVVPVNTFALLAEVEANPAAFGLVNATSPACTTSSSLLCTQNTLVAPNAASTYLFADGVHPTTAADAVLAQYIEAELAAPAYISLLAEAPLAIASAQRTGVINELALDAAGGAPSGTRVFASGGYDAQTFSGQIYTPSTRNDGGAVTVGFDTRLDPALSVGGALTYGQSFASLSGGAAKFRTQEILGSLFGQYQFLGHAYVNAVAGFGDVNFRDIARSFALGPLHRLEEGSTSGSDISGTITTGYGFDLAPLRLTPYAQLQYDRVRVDPYGEGGGDSSAMTFGQQTREALVGEFGLRAQATLQTTYAAISPYLQVAYDYDARAEARSVTAGLVSMAGTFSMPGFKPDDSWGTVQAGVDARLNARIDLFASYSGRFSDQSQRYDAVNFGAKYAF